MIAMTTLTMVALAQATVPDVPRELPGGALAFMLLSMAAVTFLTVWCFMRILGGRKHFDPDGTGPARPPVPGEVELDEEQPGR